MKILRLATIFICLGFFVSNSKAISANEADLSGKVFEIVEVSEGVDGKMTEFFYKDEQGNKQSINKITKGKFVFLNFWGTWCPPCRREIPDIIGLQSDLKDKNFVVIGVALEQKDELATNMKAVSEFAQKNKINYVNFIVTNDVKKKIVGSYKGIPYVPTTFLVDKSNNVFERMQGLKTKQQFKESIDKLMNN